MKSHRSRHIYAAVTRSVLVSVILASAAPAARSEKQRIEPESNLAQFGINLDSASVIAALKHENLLVRVSAAQTLGKRKGEAVSQPLIAALADTSSTVRLAAAEALLGLGTNTGVPVLKELVADQDPDVAVQAARKLCSIGEPSGCGALTGFLKDTRWYIRSAAIRAVAECKGISERRTLLSNAVSDEHPRVRVAAMTALVEEPDSATVEVLISRLRDPDQVVRYAADKWLMELTGQSYGYQSAFPENARERAVIAWESWWAGNKQKFVPRKRAAEKQ